MYTVLCVIIILLCIIHSSATDSRECGSSFLRLRDLTEPSDSNTLKIPEDHCHSAESAARWRLEHGQDMAPTNLGTRSEGGDISGR